MTVSASGVTSVDLGRTAATIRRRLQIEVHPDPDLSASNSTSYGAHAHVSTAAGRIYGFGSATTAGEAADLATIECAERWSQFARVTPPVIRGTYAELAGVALCPLDFGLYSDAQYQRATTDLAPFDPHTPLEWVEAKTLPNGASRLVPLELIHPNAPIGRPRLAVETSSGTAAHLDTDEATVTALCEVVERDALMLFWHRRPTTPVQPHSSLPANLRTELSSVRSNGHVACVCRLDQDIRIPTYLVLALRGTSVACGMGTHPDSAAALEHAVRELSADLRRSAKAIRRLHLPLGLVRTPADHRALYDRGPLNAVLRAALANHLVRDAPVPPESDPAPTSLQRALAALTAQGLTAYRCDITPPELDDSGARVIRVLVPCLIPLSFGTDRLRLGCTRLTGTAAPGRLSTLLPHFMG